VGHKRIISGPVGTSHLCQCTKKPRSQRSNDFLNLGFTISGRHHLADPVCTENLIRVDDVMESPKLAE